MEGKQIYILFGVGLLVAVAMSLVLVLGSSRSGSSESKSGGSLASLQETAAPWQPEYKSLAERIQALSLPAAGAEDFHIHAKLEVYVNGQAQPVPASIGLPPGGAHSVLHTHDADSIAHIEAPAPFDATLSQFFGIWGVKFTDTQLGSYRNNGQDSVQVFVNGRPQINPAQYVLKNKDEVVVGYGAPGSVPAKLSSPFPAGL